MQRRFQFIVALFIIQMVSGMSVTADRSIPLSLNKIIENAGYIFQGECINIRTGRDPETNLLATWFTFRVKQGIKGDLGEEFVLKQYGGSDENYTITPTSVQYEVGEELVLFVYPPSSIGFSSSVGLHQGKFLIKKFENNEKRLVTNGTPAMVLFEGMDEKIPTRDTAGTRAEGITQLKSDKMELDEFLSFVKKQVQQKNMMEK